MAANHSVDEELQRFLQMIQLPRAEREQLLAGNVPAEDQQLSKEFLDLLRHDLEMESEGYLQNGKLLRSHFEIAPEETEWLVEGVTSPSTKPDGIPHLKPGDEVDNFRIIRFIDEGGMGAVYLVEDTKIHRRVALKILTRGSVERFEKEKKAVAALEHSLIVRLYDTGSFSGSPYFTMEYIPGETLQERIKGSPNTGLPPEEVARILSDIGQAVAYAHKRGVLHRDLKPSNIFIDSEGKPRVGDFGLAKVIGDDSDLTKFGGAFGSPSYMAPEQTLATEFETSEATDVYGLGATLYAAIVGRPPFQGDQQWDVFKLINSAEPVPPSRLVAGVPIDLETICLKCLEKNPQQRYQSAEAFADDLDRFLRNEPILARPVGQLEKARRWCLRRPASAALILAASLLLVSLGGWAIREIQTRSEAKSRLSETLVVRSELFAQQGKWRESLRDLDEADRLGNPDPVRVQLLRVRGLVAVSDSDAYFEALERLSKMGSLGPHEGESHLMRGLSLLVAKNPDAARAEFEAAISAPELTDAKHAVAKAMLADTSLEAISYLEQAVNSDPTSHFAQQYLASILMLLGRYEEAVDRCHVAEALFPESPVFPMLMMLAASATGDQEHTKKILEHPALQQLEPSSLEEFVSALSAFQLLQEMVVRGFDFDLTRKEFLSNREAMLQTAAPFITRLSFLTTPREAANTTGQEREQLLTEIGISTFHRAYDLFSDTVSLRTFGFLMTGKGDTDRIDELINQLERAFEIHSDGFFQFCRGRLLYSRGRLTEASQAYVMANEYPSIFAIVREDAAYAVARCCLARYEAGETEALALAATYMHRRLEYSQPTPKHAEVLLRVAEESLDYESAKMLAPLMEEGPALTLRLAKVAFQCKLFEEAIQYCSKVPAGAPEKTAADSIVQGVEKGLRSQLKAIAPSGE